MTKIKNAILLATCLVIGMATAGYAGSGTLEGNLTQEPKAGDKFALKCSETGEICASICDAGPANDNSFGVTIKSKNTGTKVTVLAPAGGCSADVCLANSQRANFTIFCDENASLCDDNYSAQFTCQGEVRKLTQEGNE